MQQTILDSTLSDFDLNLREKVQPEREAVEEAKARRNEVKRELERLENVLQRRRQEAEDTALLEGAGVSTEGVDVASVEEGVKAKREELQAAEAALSDAKEALREKTEALRSELRNQIRERRDEALSALQDGLNKAQWANLKLFALAGVSIEADLGAGVPYAEVLLPAVVGAGPHAGVAEQVAEELPDEAAGEIERGLVTTGQLQQYRSTLRRECRATVPLDQPDMFGTNEA